MANARREDSWESVLSLGYRGATNYYCYSKRHAGTACLLMESSFSPRQVFVVGGDNVKISSASKEKKENNKVKQLLFCIHYYCWLSGKKEVALQTITDILPSFYTIFELW